jgi:Spy/CpxP family protein refolding chaperone
MKRLVLAACAALLVVPALAVPANAAPGDEPAPGRAPPPFARRDGPGGLRGPGRGFFRHLRERRRHAVRFLRSLELSDAQRTLLRESREATENVRVDVRARVRSILADAWKAGDRSPEARKAVREKVRAVIASARTAVEATAKKIFDSLTAEQRAKIEARAKAHGREVDDARLLRRIEGLLLMPRHGPGRAARR